MNKSDEGAQAMKPKKQPKSCHTKTGNCWAVAYTCTTNGCRKGERCDVCHQHYLPRGGCTECPPCRACESGKPVKGPGYGLGYMQGRGAA
jgi:hypothetical protein